MQLAAGAIQIASGDDVAVAFGDDLFHHGQMSAAARLSGGKAQLAPSTRRGTNNFIFSIMDERRRLVAGPQLDFDVTENH